MRTGKNNKKVRVVNFSRNFGHEAAMIAGIDYASGDGIVCMDADLQHPPECIPQIIEKFEEGYDVVSMIRSSREDGGFIKKITSSLFYKVLNCLSPIKFENNASDFCFIPAGCGCFTQRVSRKSSISPGLCSERWF